MRKYIVVFAIAAITAALVLAGCNSGGGSSSVAEINGKKITSDDIVKFMSRGLMGQHQVSGVLTQLLEEELVLDLAAEKKVTPTDTQIDQRLNYVKRVAGLDEFLENSGLTMDDYKHQLKIDQARINLAETTMKDKIKDEDVKKEYNQNKDTEFAISERIKMDAIILPNKATADDASKKLASGASLQKVADEAGLKVEHRTIPKTGTPLPDDLIKALFETEKGKATKPISVGGMPGSEQWIIMVPGDKIPEVIITLEEAKPVIHAELVMRSASDDLRKMIEKAGKDAKLTVTMPALKDVEKSFKKPEPTGNMMTP